jgi:hypothetical protein
MDNTKQSASDQLRSKAKKLEMLATLLEDGEIASELAGLFSSPAPAPLVVARPSDASTIQKSRTPQRKATHRKHARKRRGLEEKVVETVNSSPTPVTARAVTERLEGAGFTFGAQNHQVAVSKALRQAAKMTKIAEMRNGGYAKAAIIYTALKAASIVPVQGSAN